MTSPVSPAAIDATWSRGRLMGALFAAQACASAGQSIGMAVGGIMAAEITGTNAWTGLPVAVGALGTALASWPLARWGPTDLAMADNLARLQLEARRVGCSIELRQAGVSVRVIEMPGDKHAGEYANEPVPGSSRTVLDVAIAFLRSEL